MPGIEQIYLLDGPPQADWLSPHSYDELIATAEPFHRDIMEVDENALAELFYTSGTSDVPLLGLTIGDLLVYHEIRGNVEDSRRVTGT